MKTSPIILALDYPQAELAIAAAERLDPSQCQLKIGKALFTRAGPSVVEQLMKMGFKVFLDLKFHDIPNTVAMACKAAADLGVWMMNIHCLGGLRMMQQARAAFDDYPHPPLLLGVTVLTSMAQTDLNQIGIESTPQASVIQLAQLAQQAGLDGVVCSAQEAASLRTQCGEKFTLVTPGIRMQQMQDDQRRVATPAQAIRDGSDYLVIGRPVLQASHPDKVLEQILAEVKSAQKDPS